MILPSINKQASNAQNTAPSSALQFNCAWTLIGFQNNQSHRHPRPSVPSRAVLYSLHSSGCSAGGHRACSKSHNPRPPPFVTYRKEKSQTRCLWYRSCFSLTANRLNGEKIHIFLHLLLLKSSLMCLLWSFRKDNISNCVLIYWVADKLNYFSPNSSTSKSSWALIHILFHFA